MTTKKIPKSVNVGSFVNELLKGSPKRPERGSLGTVHRGGDGGGGQLVPPSQQGESMDRKAATTFYANALSQDTGDFVPSLADVSRVDAQVERAIEEQKQAHETPTSTYQRHQDEYVQQQELLDNTLYYQQQSNAAAAEKEAEHAMALKMEAMHYAREKAGIALPMDSPLRPPHKANHQWTSDSRGNFSSSPSGAANAARLKKKAAGGGGGGGMKTRPTSPNAPSAANMYNSNNSKKISTKEAKVADEVAAKKAAQVQANEAARARRAKLNSRKHTKPKWKQEAEKKIFEEKERRRAQKMLEKLAIEEAQEEQAITEARKRNGKYSMKSAKTQDHIGSAFINASAKGTGKRPKKSATSNGAPGTFGQLKAQKMPASPQMSRSQLSSSTNPFGLSNPSPARINVFGADPTMCPF